jgi:MFS family permease
MDLTPYLGWIVFLHVLGAFLFAAGHGVSVAVAYRVKAERDPARLKAYLDLSAWSLTLAGIGLLLILLFGIIAGVVAGSFGRAWIWVSLVLFIAIGGLMTPFAAIPLAKIRVALGQRTRGMKPDDPDPVPLPMDQVVPMLEGVRPGTLAAIGGGGFVVILYLMMFKPF